MIILLRLDVRLTLLALGVAPFMVLAPVLEASLRGRGPVVLRGGDFVDAGAGR